MSLLSRAALRRAWALGLVAALTTACSVIIEHRDRQCSTDAECKGFENAVCDVANGVCVKKPAPGCDDSGCWSCPPTNTHQLQIACTDATCVPYDNGPLQAYLTADGGLPAIP